MRGEIVIVGGGAGGLELASKLGRKLGPARVMLVDSRLTHIWKPSLHEVAAGTLDAHQEGLSYQMLAHDNGFTFVYGALTALDTQTRKLSVSPVLTPDGEQILPERVVEFASLVIAVGSTSNYFGVPGAQEHTISLNATEDAERFRLSLLKQLAQADAARGAGADAHVNVVIIGGGATGVELAAELYEASSVYASYGFANLRPERDVRITLLEGAPRILAPLPERVAAAAHKLLTERGVTVVTECRVTSIEAQRVTDSKGVQYPASLCVWAAGIRAPAFLGQLGLPTNKGGQIEVDGMLRVKGFTDIYALGDCAANIGPDGKQVPPRAQAAHQQADYLRKRLLRIATRKSPGEAPYVYLDYGSLVSFGHRNSVGSLMGSLKGLNFFVDGLFARMMYASLHLMHHAAVLGALKTGVLAVARFLIKRSSPLVKLH
ncbi:NAD(P)/FAD-dependent oxidoreductase [Massilia sp. CF038]|uniref:NAD(P)/FAD-dependent oxidoreductase n=1 Tax=Massilia sp. CF038 TaxID=1881045 RepID=UPI000914F909|nr:NAD(P)/FAD-dependent oxidoreductase [Massilia sp. CF038]SHH01030.1 NADH dehydrogenase [Massilia sp. CF038]